MASCFWIHQNTDQSDKKKRKRKETAAPFITLPPFCQSFRINFYRGKKISYENFSIKKKDKQNGGAGVLD